MQSRCFSLHNDSNLSPYLIVKHEVKFIDLFFRPSALLLLGSSYILPKHGFQWFLYFCLCDLDAALMPTNIKIATEEAFDN